MKIITICGSMMFYEKYIELAEVLTNKNFQVYIPTAEEVSFIEMGPKEKIRAKKQYIQEHLDRIKESDYVLIANYDKRGVKGYIGPNTLIEVAFARALDKPLYMINTPGEQYCIDELRGFEFKQFDMDQLEF